MSENITFRTAFVGFNREDVINYIKKLMSEKEDEVKRLAELEGKCEADSIRLAELEEKIKNAADCASCDLAKKNEARIGAAMLDARRFSELIVDEANARSAEMYGAASVDAYSSSQKAVELADKMKTMAEEYAAAFDELLGKMTGLADTLGSFGNEVSDKKEEFELLFDKREPESEPERKPAAEIKKPEKTGAASGWREPFTEGVFDPDFNFLDVDSDYSIKINVDDK